MLLFRLGPLTDLRVVLACPANLLGSGSADSVGFQRTPLLSGRLWPTPATAEAAENGVKAPVSVQARDKDTGLPLWQVEVLDADPDAGKKGRTVVVKFAAKVQPIPPENTSDLPFRPVEFDGLSALPYVETTGNNFSRIAWSLRAEDMHSPSKAGSGSPVAKAVA